MKVLLIPFVALMCLALPAGASPIQDTAKLRRAAGLWLERQAETEFTDTSAKAEVGPVDERLRLAACARPEFFLPAGARPWGSGTLGARCGAPTPWSLYLTYRVRLTGPALVARRPLPARQPLAAGDVELALVEYEGDPGGYPRELPPGSLAGRPIPQGQPVFLNWLALPQVIAAGAKVQVLVQGRNFTVSQEGTALHAARAGEGVRVKTPSGRIVQGVANAAGQVEVRP